MNDIEKSSLGSGEDAFDYEFSLTAERRVTMASIAILSVLMVFDLIEDGVEGVELSHIAIEGVGLAIAVAVLFFLFTRSFKKFGRTERRLTQEILAAREDAKLWRERASSLIRGLSQAIDEQFETWGLTGAEKEVGLLLLKGLSHKEIAAVRDTAERTVRQQAATVYKKAKVEGRAELSAFFLEDLFMPAENPGQR